MRIYCNIVLAAMATSAVAATSGGNHNDAMQLLDKTGAFYNEHGRASTFAAINGKRPPFSGSKHYVFCIGPDRKVVADGEFREFVGQSADAIKDSSGKPLGQSFWESAQKEVHSEVHYQFLDPSTHLIKPKVSYLQKMGSDACGVGTYEAQ